MARSYKKLPLFSLALFGLKSKLVGAQFVAFDIISTLGSIQAILMHVGPILSAVLFIVAGIFYALGQIMPPIKRGSFHITAIDIVIGAIIVAVLSVAANTLAVASSTLLANVTANTL